MTEGNVSKITLNKEQLIALQNIAECIEEEGVDAYLAFIQVMEENELKSGRVEEGTLNDVFLWAEQHAHSILNFQPSIHSHYRIAALINALFRLGNNSIIESYNAAIQKKMQEEYV